MKNPGILSLLPLMRPGFSNSFSGHAAPSRHPFLGRAQ